MVIWTPWVNKVRREPLRRSPYDKRWDPQWLESMKWMIWMTFRRNPKRFSGKVNPISPADTHRYCFRTADDGTVHSTPHQMTTPSLRPCPLWDICAIYSTRARSIFTSFTGRSCASTLTSPICLTILIPSFTRPKIVCLPSK